jgi:hypothetical protein
MMKFSVTAAAASAALLAAAFAAPAAAEDVEIRDAVARVVVMVEDRADVAVEVSPGTANLPPIKVTRRGDKLFVDGDLGRNAIRNCRSGPAGARQPGEGAVVEVRDRGRINLSEAPLIIIRSPRAVDVSAEGAVFGSVGRGATSIELGAGGCGDWTVANTAGRMSLAVGGSGAIRAGTSASLEAAVGGSGSILAGATRDLEASVGGSGSITVARVDGHGEVAIGGSGDVTVRAGAMNKLDVAIGGSGNVDFPGSVGDLDVAIAGSGDVRVGSVSGRVERAVLGSGNVRVGA